MPKKLAPSGRHEDHFPQAQRQLAVLIGIVELEGQNVQRGASLASGRPSINQGHDPREGVARSNLGQVLKGFFPMQHPLHIDTQTGPVLSS